MNIIAPKLTDAATATAFTDKAVAVALALGSKGRLSFLRSPGMGDFKIPSCWSRTSDSRPRGDLGRRHLRRISARASRAILLEVLYEHGPEHHPRQLHASLRVGADRASGLGTSLTHQALRQFGFGFALGFIITQMHGFDLKLWPKLKSLKAESWSSIKWRPMCGYYGFRWKRLLRLGAKWCNFVVAHFKERYGVSNPKAVIEKIERFNDMMGEAGGDEVDLCMEFYDIKEFFPSENRADVLKAVDDYAQRLLLNAPALIYL